MPIIVLEGPDESGKTTLAERLHDHFMPVFPPANVEIQRSPVKEHGWSHEYNHYLINLCQVTNHLVIQDRSPEISESIYGYMRGGSRSHGWLMEAGDWFHQPIFMIFCEGPATLRYEHRDAEGLKVAHDEINLLYDYTFGLLDNLVNSARLTDFQIAKYNRLDEDQGFFYWQLCYWLSRQFPRERSGILKALNDLVNA